MMKKIHKIDKKQMIFVVVIILVFLVFSFIGIERYQKYKEDTIEYYRGYTEQKYDDFKNLANKFDKYQLYQTFLEDSKNVKFKEISQFYESYIPSMRQYFIDYYNSEIEKVYVLNIDDSSNDSLDFIVYNNNRLNLYNSNQSFQKIKDEIENDKICSSDEINSLYSKIDLLIAQNLNSISVLSKNYYDTELESFKTNLNVENEEILNGYIENYSNVLNAIKDDSLLTQDEKNYYFDLINQNIEICQTKILAINNAIKQDQENVKEQEKQEDAERKTEEREHQKELDKTDPGKVYEYTDSNGKIWYAPDIVNNLIYVQEHKFDVIIYMNEEINAEDAIWYDLETKISYDSNGEEIDN